MGWLAHSFGWRSVFFVMGGVGIVAAFFFVKFIHSPVDHPAINKAEFDYIEAGGGLVRMEDKNTANGAAFTWPNVKQVLTSRMLLGVYLGQYCINVLTYFFVTWFPIYLVKERGLSILQAGFTAAAARPVRLRRRHPGRHDLRRLLKKTGNLDIARKTPLLLGMVLATSIILCNFVEQEWLVIVIMAAAFFGKGVASLGWAVVADTSPKEMAGVTGGIFNTFGNVAGIVTPIVIGYIVKGTGSFDGALIFVGAHCVIAIAAYFLIVGKIQRLELKPA
jgi:ACS family glucarate transporter-like MFS transporter